MKIPKISEAAAMGDEELSEFLGFPSKLESFKVELQELDSLKGAARKEAERMWMERLTPSVSSDSLQWIKEDAVRSTKKGKALLEDTSPSSIEY